MRNRGLLLYLAGGVAAMVLATMLAYGFIYSLAWIAADRTHFRFFVTFYLLGCATGYIIGRKS